MEHVVVALVISIRSGGLIVGDITAALQKVGGKDQ